MALEHSASALGAEGWTVPISTRYAARNGFFLFLIWRHVYGFPWTLRSTSLDSASRSLVLYQRPMDRSKACVLLHTRPHHDQDERRGMKSARHRRDTQYPPTELSVSSHFSPGSRANQVPDHSHDREDLGPDDSPAAKRASAVPIPSHNPALLQRLQGDCHSRSGDKPQFMHAARQCAT